MTQLFLKLFCTAKARLLRIYAQSVHSLDNAFSPVYQGESMLLHLCTAHIIISPVIATKLKNNRTCGKRAGGPE